MTTTNHDPPHMTPDLLERLRDVSQGRAISRTSAGKLARLGLVTIRETKVYSQAEKKIARLFDVKLTTAGRVRLVVD